MHAGRLRGWAARLAGPFGRARRDRELAEELESHLRMQIDDNVRAGMSPREARRQALVKLGGAAQAVEECRRRSGVPMLEDFWKDVRFGARVLLKQPTFTLVAVLTLALGIGANTAIYSVLHAAFFAQYPLAEPDALHRVYGEDLSRNLTQLNMSVPKFKFVREQQTAFSGLGAANFNGFTLLDRGEPLQINGAFVTADFLQTFGAAPVVGRFFEPGEEEGGPPAAVLSETLWRERFGADPSVVGRGVTLSGVAYTVIGVAPRLPGFWQAEVWVTRPFQSPGISPELLQRGVSFLAAVGRLKPGVTAERAQQELVLIAERYRADNADKVDSTWNVVTVPVRADIVGAARSPVFTLMAAVGLVLLIACANVANLVLVRFAGRRREVALRTALGASRRRVVQLFLIETLLVSATACVLGVLLAAWSLPMLIDLARSFITFSSDIHLNLPVLGATAGVSLLVGLLIGVYPAAQASRHLPAVALREGGRGLTGGGQNRMRGLLVTGQVAVSLLLLTGAALLTASFLRLRNQPPGFRTDGVFVANLTLPPSRYPDIGAQSRFYLRLAEEMRAAPGVTGASLIQGLPLSNNNTRAPYASAEGDVPPVKERPLGLTRSVTPGYFGTLEIPLLAGRDFNERDVGSAPQVVILARSTARRLFPQGEALGRRVLMGTNNGVGLEMEVVGVVDDVRSQTLAQVAEVEFYRPVMQRQSTFMQLVVRTGSDPAAFAPTAAQVLRRLDPEMPLNSPTALSDIVGQSLAQQQLLFTLLGLFAALALLMAAVGVYSVVAYTVTMRTGEIGVRMALGARPPDILRLVLRQGMRPVLWGVAGGLAGCLALGRLIEAQLYGISATEPWVLVAACAGLAGVAAVACLLPARRATRVDPLVALRLS